MTGVRGVRARADSTQAHGSLLRADAAVRAPPRGGSRNQRETPTSQSPRATTRTRATSAHAAERELQARLARLANPPAKVVQLSEPCPGDLSRLMIDLRQGLVAQSSRNAEFSLDKTLFRFGMRWDVAIVEPNQIKKFAA